MGGAAISILIFCSFIALQNEVGVNFGSVTTLKPTDSLCSSTTDNP